jgi:EAL and modified HD-GYP domain-containing signal transduction protein
MAVGATMTDSDPGARRLADGSAQAVAGAVGPDIYVGRQPVVDATLRLWGYELLYRDGQSAGANFTDGDAATYHVVVRALLDLGFDDLVGSGQAFVNATPKFLADGGYRFLPAKRTVIEILENIDVDEQIEDSARQVKRDGYRLALDDYCGPSSHDRLGPLLSFVKVDVLAVPAGDLEGVVAHARQMAPGALLIAEKVETNEDVEYCRKLGFHLFQGYSVGRPQQLSGRQVPASSIAALRLIAELERPGLSVADLAVLIERDPVLSYRLLRLINCAATVLSREVTSVRQAIVLTGIEGMRRLASVLALTTAVASPTHLLEQLVVRAKMCQTMAETSDQGDLAASAFTVGLFSGLDLLLGVPMKEVLADLPLSAPVNAALLEGSGPLGDLPRSAVQYETARIDDLASSGSLTDWRDAYLGAVSWAGTLRADISGGLRS